jgi:DNA-binding transcriptional MerR regulator
MSNEKIRELLDKLHEEVQKTEVDASTRSSLQELDSEIHDLLESSTSEQKVSSVVEQAKLLEAEFAIKHPTVERFMREVTDILAKMGV